MGTRLRQIERRFKNRTEAAAVAGVSKSTLQNWIEGRSDPGFEGLVKLAKATGVSLDWIASGQEGDPALANLDEGLFVKVVEWAEEFMGEEGLKVPPAKRGRLYLALYRYTLKSRDRHGDGDPGGFDDVDLADIVALAAEPE